MNRIAARWVELGCLAPLDLHAAYAGLAQAAAADAQPAVLWARCERPHLSVGASQAASAELDLTACQAVGVPVIQRPLGGGTVLVDGDQLCFFFVLPRAQAPGRHAALFDACLEPVCATFQALGLPTTRVGNTDVWLQGRKILGSGAATLNTSMVLGASFLLRFDAALFARVVRCPSAGFRHWLVQALEEAMTAWDRHGPVPAEQAIKDAFRHQVAEHLGWQWQESTPSAAEREAMAQAREELTEPLEPGPRRLIANGIKVNHATYLVETHAPQGDVRVLIRAQRIARIEVEGYGALSAVLQACLDLEPDAQRLHRCLSAHLPQDAAQYWSERIDRAASDVRRVWNG